MGETEVGGWRSGMNREGDVGADGSERAEYPEQEQNRETAEMDQ